MNRSSLSQSEASTAIEDTEERAIEASWKALFIFTTGRHLFIALPAVILSILAGFIVPAESFLYGKVFAELAKLGGKTIETDEFMQNVDKYSLWLVCLGAVAWFVVGGDFSTWSLYGAMQTANARDRLFLAMLDGEVHWFDARKQGVGALLARLNMYLIEFQAATSSPSGLVIQYLTCTVASLGVALYFAWELTLLTISILPIAAVAVWLCSKNIQPNIDMQAERLGEAAKHSSNAMSSIESVKCFNGHETELRKYTSVMEQASAFYNRQIYWSSGQNAVLRLATLGMFVGGFWYGSYLVQTNKRDAGAVVTTFWSTMMATTAFMAILPSTIVFEKGRMAGAKLHAIIKSTGDSPIHLIEDKQRTFQTCFGQISITNLSFYHTNRLRIPILRNVSMEFPAGRLVFIIGKSGSGKSTIAHLLLRFHEISQGHASLDGQSINDISVDRLRQSVFLVEQTSVLFRETIAQNIALGRHDLQHVDERDIRAAAKFAQLEDTINQLPKGYETVVGVKGSTLSGGQRQRIAIARARIRNPPVLVLDEATSALDNANSAMIMQNIRQWRRGKTTIMITHDITFIQPDDLMYLLQDGEVVQHGTRRKLESESTSPFRSFLNEHKGSQRDPEKSEAPKNNDQSQMPIRKSSLSFSPFTDHASTSEGDLHSNHVLHSPLQSPSKMDEPLDSYLTQRGFRGSIIMPPLFASSHGSPARRNAMRPASVLSPFWHMSPASAPPKARNETGLDSFEMTNISLEHNCKHSKASGQVPDEGFDRVETLELRSILATFWPQASSSIRLLLVAAILALLMYAISTPVFSWIFSKLLSTFYVTANAKRMAMIYSLAILGIALLDATTIFYYQSQFAVLGQIWVNRLRLEAFHRILEQPREFFNITGNEVGRIAEVLDAMAEIMQGLIARFLPAVILASIMMSVAVVWSLVASWKLTLVGLAAMPVMYTLTRAYSTVASKLDVGAQAAVEDVSAIFEETFKSIRTVKSLTLEAHFTQKFKSANQKCLQAATKRAIISGSFYGLAESAIIFVTALLFHYGAALAAKHQSSVNDIIIVFTELLFGLANVQSILGLIPQMSGSKDAASRLLRLARLPEINSEHHGTARITTVGDISFTNCRFSYANHLERPILRNFTLNISTGSCIALVGPSGSGKSTIASLLLKLYNTPEAPFDAIPMITLGGRDITHVHTPTLRTLVSLVSQTPFLFPASIAENITYGLRSCNMRGNTQAIRAAAEAAGVDEFIMSLPDGYETIVGEGGMGVSGGQAQRISIARALIRKPNVLILDEATSALDVESAAVFRESVRRILSADRSDPVSGAIPISLSRDATGRRDRLTVIIITHAKEMMNIADRVVMLDKGAVVEQGEYADLMRTRGAFWKLVSGAGWAEESNTGRRRSTLMMDQVAGVNARADW